MRDFLLFLGKVAGGLAFIIVGNLVIALGVIWLFGSSPGPSGGLVAAASLDRQFGGFDCSDDCSGHAAGYRWAQRRGVTAAAECDNPSASFREGCLTFIDDPSRGADEDDAGEEID